MHAYKHLDISFMAKTKTTYLCQNCGAQYARWQGQCNACKEWNTLVEEVIEKKPEKTWKSFTSSTPKRISKPQRINDIKIGKEIRIPTSNQE